VRGIKALDADKPFTPNSEVRYLIAASKSQAMFSLVMDANGSATLVLKEPLDYDSGDEQFLLEVYAKDEGSPPKNTSTVIEVRVKRDESRVLKFTGEVYHSQFKEHFPITVTAREMLSKTCSCPHTHRMCFYANVGQTDSPGNSFQPSDPSVLRRSRTERFYQIFTDVRVRRRCFSRGPHVWKNFSPQRNRC